MCHVPTSFNFIGGLSAFDKKNQFMVRIYEYTEWHKIRKLGNFEGYNCCPPLDMIFYLLPLKPNFGGLHSPPLPPPP